MALPQPAASPTEASATAGEPRREVWLWDFGGQADQRLIHQLFLDRAALVLLLFNAERDEVIEGLRDWQAALGRSLAEPPPSCWWPPASTPASMPAAPSCNASRPKMAAACRKPAPLMAAAARS